MKKYIRFSDGSFKIFSGELFHCEQCDGKHPVSAGFVFLINGKLRCTGGSISLNLEVQPEDSEKLTKWLSELV